MDDEFGIVDRSVRAIHAWASTCHRSSSIRSAQPWRSGTGSSRIDSDAGVWLTTAAPSASAAPTGESTQRMGGHIGPAKSLSAASTRTRSAGAVDRTYPRQAAPNAARSAGKDPVVPRRSRGRCSSARRRRRAPARLRRPERPARSPHAQIGQSVWWSRWTSQGASGPPQWSQDERGDPSGSCHGPSCPLLSQSGRASAISRCRDARSMSPSPQYSPQTSQEPIISRPPAGKPAK